MRKLQIAFEGGLEVVSTCSGINSTTAEIKPIMAESTRNQLTIQQRQHIWTGAAAVATFCAQLATAIMSSLPSPSSKEKEKREMTIWTEEEVTSLVDYLMEHQVEGGDAGGFKTTTFNNAAKHLAPLFQRGLVKTGKTVKTKWSGVCYKQIILKHY